MTLHSLILFLSAFITSSCMDWTQCGEGGCFAVFPTPMSWDDAFAECRKKDAFLISPENEYLSEKQGFETWISLRRNPDQFFFQSYDHIPKFYRSLSEAQAPLNLVSSYNDRHLCFTVKKKTIISKDCNDKVGFVCHRGHPQLFRFEFQMNKPHGPIFNNKFASKLGITRNHLKRTIEEIYEHVPGEQTVRDVKIELLPENQMSINVTINLASKNNFDQEELTSTLKRFLDSGSIMGVPVQNEYPSFLKPLPTADIDFTSLKLRLNVTSSNTPDSTRCHHNEYLNIHPNYNEGPNLSIDCNFFRNQNQEIYKYASMNLLCNGYYTDKKSPPWSFDMTSVDRYNILMGRDGLTVTQFQCAAWIPGLVEPLLSQKVIVRFDLDFFVKDYFISEKVIKFYQITEVQGMRVGELLHYSRLNGVHNLTETLKGVNNLFNAAEDNWFLADITLDEDKEEFKLKIVAADSNQGEDTQSTTLCPDSVEGDSLWNNFQGKNKSRISSNRQDELTIRKCECDLLNGAQPIYYLGRGNDSLNETTWVGKQERMENLACNTLVCVPKSVTKELQNVNATNITSDNVLEIMEKVQNLTSNPAILTAEDVYRTAAILKQVSKNVVANQSILSKIVLIANNILEITKEEVISQTQIISSNQIIPALEDIVQKSDIEIDNRSIEIVFDNIAVAISKVSEMGMAGFAIFGDESLSYEKSEVRSIESLELINYTSLPVAFTFPNASLNPEDKVSFIAYRKNNFFKSRQVNYKGEKLQLNSQVVGIQVNGSTSKQLSQPVQVIFRPQLPINNKIDTKCMFWDEFTGGWSDGGCSFKSFLGELYICECSHLTNVAVLFYNNDKIVEEHDLVLENVSKTSFCLSIGEILSGMIIIYENSTRGLPNGRRRKVEVRRKCILFNLCLALLVVMIIFLYGIDSEKYSSHMCIVVAVMLHYFILAYFQWMLMLAVVLSLAVKEVFFNYPYFRRDAYLFAWGVPTVIVSCTAVFSISSYTTDNDCCWMSGNALYIAFLLPTGLVMLAIFCAFGIISRVKQSENSWKNTMLKKAIMLFMLLGLSWISGWFIMIETKKTFFSYIFCISATIQGLAILYNCIPAEISFRKSFQECFGSANQASSSPKIKSFVVSSRTRKASESPLLLDIQEPQEQLLNG